MKTDFRDIFFVLIFFGPEWDISSFFFFLFHWNWKLYIFFKKRNSFCPALHWKELVKYSCFCPPPFFTSGFPCRQLWALHPPRQEGGLRHTCWRTPAAPSGWQCGRASPAGSAGWSGKWWGAAGGSGLWRFGLSFHRRPKERRNLTAVPSEDGKGKTILTRSWPQLLSLRNGA